MTAYYDLPLYVTYPGAETYPAFGSKPSPTYPHRIAWTWEDDFTTQNARWDWVYLAGTGYRTCPMTEDGRVSCEAGILDESVAETYSDQSLHHFFDYAENEYVFAEYTLKFTDNGLHPAVGSRGMGLYDGTNLLVWFWCASEESSAAQINWRAQIYVAPDVLLNPLLSVDTTIWHKYRVEITPQGTFFKVDGALVAALNTVIAPTVDLELCTWIDNGVYNTSRVANLDAAQDQIEYIHHCSFYHSAVPP